MTSVTFDIEQVKAAFPYVSEGARAAGSSQPTYDCGTMFRSLANGSFKHLTPEDHSRLRRAACAIARSYRSDKGLQALLLEIGTDLTQFKRLEATRMLRAKTFCENLISYRS